MKRIKGLISGFLILTMMITVIGCGQKNNDNTPSGSNTAVENQDNNNDASNDTNEQDTSEQDANDNTTEEEANELSGEVKVGGSTSVEKVAKLCAEEFMARNVNVTINYDATGSGSGVENAHSGTYQVGCASRNIKDSEKDYGLEEVVICYDGVAPVIHPENPVNDLSKDQLKQIFTGEVKNWKEFGGNDAPIVVFSRDDSSGTRETFDKACGFHGELVNDAMIQGSNSDMQSSVAENPNSIGYVSFAYINDSIKPLTVSGVDANNANVQTGDYTISRPFLMIYHEENMSEEAHAYINFILSDAGQEIVAQKHIPVK